MIVLFKPIVSIGAVLVDLFRSYVALAYLFILNLQR